MRDETPRPHFSLLQIFRGWAAILVVLIHATYIAAGQHGAPIAGNFFAMGNAGVDFFFVLSGFLITHLHLNDIGRPERLRQYLRKRFVRVFPIYWIVTLVILPVYFLVPRFGQGDETTAFVIASSLLLTPLERGPILIAGWSLTHELLFYLIFAALITSRGAWVKVLVAFWAIAVVVAVCFSFNQSYAVAFPGFNAWMRVLLWPQNAEFILGAAAAWIVARRPDFLPSREGALALLPVAWLALLASGLFPGVLHNIQAGQHVVYFGVLSFLIVIAAVVIDTSGGSPAAIRRSSLYRFQEYLGDASYSIYLVHGPALSLAYKIAGWAGLFQMVPGAIVNAGLCCVAVAVSCLCHSLIERPLLRYFGRRRPTQVVAVTALR